jgi:hypothetical protein
VLSGCHPRLLSAIVVASSRSYCNINFLLSSFDDSIRLLLLVPIFVRERLLKYLSISIFPETRGLGLAMRAYYRYDLGPYFMHDLFEHLLVNGCLLDDS